MVFSIKPPKSAIPFRNEWMVNRSDTVICYIAHEHGGAARFVELARGSGEKIINLFVTAKGLL